MKNNIKIAQQRAVFYWLIDGLVELALSGISLLLGSIFYIWATQPPESVLYKISSIGFVPIVITSGLLSFWLVRVFKEHITFPRTGFIAPRRANISTMERAAQSIFSGLLAGLSYLIFTMPATYNWYPMAVGLCFGVVMLVFAASSSLLRLYILAGIAVLLGGGLALGGIGDVLGLAVFFWGAGALPGRQRRLNAAQLPAR